MIPLSIADLTRDAAGYRTGNRGTFLGNPELRPESAWAVASEF